MNTQLLREELFSGKFDRVFQYLYSEKSPGQRARYAAAAEAFEKLFGQGREAELFSAPGRTEIGGNHTDHQHGCVLAAGVNLDVIAVASKNSEQVIRIQSEGFPMDTIDLGDLSVQAAEKNQAAALIRGVAARMKQLGYPVGGFDAYTTSNVLKGSGLSSSAAFEVLVGTILNHLYAKAKSDPVEIAQIGQYAENVYFGKPCGLMDQTASSVGGFVAIDFCDPAHPVVEKVGFDFAASGYKLCIVDTGGDHADLTADYAAMPAEMKSVAAVFGKEVLRDVLPEEFYKNLAKVRVQCTDRAILRAFHFFADNERAPKEAEALRRGDFAEFKRLIIESGRSSFMYLQNCSTFRSAKEQGIPLALALSEHILKDRGAWRVHGGGLAGTIQCFVPSDMLENYQHRIESVFGPGSCHVLSIRPAGGVKVSEELLK
ncbi:MULTISPECIES: galactokinase [Anaerotruncus]|uniref:galactokinase n=1 Tax=Anaerotruncus TaxID=244127 RepID=UPI000830A2F8|nr:MULTISPECIES: galactokinase family protein [Anaerotruncus]RGX54335.1 galactokinase [Anaerotruncus sp. AF02-27]